MINLELFQIYHLKEISFSAELFLSCSILQLTFYAISTAYERRSGFVILNQQIYYVGFLLVILSLFLLLNEDLLAMNEFSSNNFIINDYLGFAAKLMICITSAAFLLVINTSFRDEPIQNNFEYVVLITISILGLLLLCSANDLITAYLAVELHSIAFYIMAAFKRDSSYSIESGLKYFIIGALSSTFFLFGSSIIYGCMGSLIFDDLRMFFSLLSLPTANLEAPLIFGGMGNFLDPLTFTLILSCNSFLIEIPSFQPCLTSPDNLVDWCCLNGEKEIILQTVFNDFQSIPGGAYLKIHPISIDFSSSVFAVNSIASQGLNSGLLIFCHNIHFVNSFVDLELLSNLSSSKNTNIEESLSFLKQVYRFYLNSTVSVTTPINSSMLNLNFVSIGFFFICVSLFIKLSIAPFHFWSLDVYEGSPNTTTFFFCSYPQNQFICSTNETLLREFLSSLYCRFSDIFFCFGCFKCSCGLFGGS
jgi:hypothetical protein